MTEPKQAVSRSEQRRQTELRILRAARRSFAEHGFDRTTIRAVAREARVNPGLVMHYYGSKEELFVRATRVESAEPAAEGSPEQIAEQLLDALRTKLTSEPDGTLAVLRSMLTHPEAARGVREALNRQHGKIYESLPGEDAALRAGLTGAITLGVVVGRFLLELDGLRDAPPERIVELLEPCVQSLVGAEPRPPHGFEPCGEP
ncbi:TetR/AcrR family transcriptional regulator [Allonocardiopsis opalescens]|uniref:TetR family transcriptional regulator n=1 Tax=Allonocardiopsis opalescens TaxID=1144618 RepID=A0A2T0Q5D9_9ACTN|nr:TetR/AcrR family transcriptional regulator [Allonocardiopsis opalescens]PRX99037.1 TetR family transcriptional regulator [Allonocardiopsis opalescens]